MKEMSLVEHLEELKTCAIRVFFTFVIGFIVCYLLSSEIQLILLDPLQKVLGESKGELIFLGVFDKVITQFMVALWSGILLTAPVWFYHLWVFIKPALYDQEIVVVRPFILVGFILFVLGVCFGYFIVFPLAFKTLMQLGVEGVAANINFKYHLSLSVKILLFLGLMFQLPNILLILGFIGLVTKYSLSTLRRYVYALFAVISAMVTPPDVLTMLGLWVPLVLLYEVGILAVALIVHPYLERKIAKDL